MQAMAQTTDAPAQAAPPPAPHPPADELVQPPDVSPEALTNTLNSRVEGFYALIPNMIVALIVLFVFWPLSRLALRVVRV